MPLTAADLFGVSAAQALGQLATEVAGQPRTVTGLGREDFAQVVAEQGWWSGSLLYQRRDGSEFLLQATGLRMPLERGAGTLWLSHLSGKDSDQQALGEALALATAERRCCTSIRPPTVTPEAPARPYPAGWPSSARTS